MKLLMIMSNMMNILFMYTKQPMNLIIIILVQTAMTTILMSTISLSSWFNYLLMIIFIGGMMVLFIYITSIAPNEKNNKFKFNIIMTVIMLTTLILLNLKTNYKNSETIMYYSQMMENYKMNLNMMFNKPIYSLSMMMMIYLFIALTVVNKISNLNQGPLRKKH
uniref:NADH dehydrogenase subunit 6 n=1 Tax=Criotettix japonicus TaxID=2793210 RepID=A0A7T0ND01_9ORTH|nr:NADH dehydrogenase subunit 6 [Criotettix japonicus]